MRMIKNGGRMMLILGVMAVCILAAFALVGCGSSDTSTAEETTPVEETSAVTEETGAAEASTTVPAPSEAHLIGEDKAKEIALGDAGFAEGDVTNLMVILEMDDGRQEYDVKFYVNDMEYEYSVGAEDGKIFEKSSESIYD